MIFREVHVYAYVQSNDNELFLLFQARDYIKTNGSVFCCLFLFNYTLQMFELTGTLKICTFGLPKRDQRVADKVILHIYLTQLSINP